ncbi:ABC transporter permease [Mycolicibacterium hodleri]|uniref:ABC transporter permease n=1 Tax=Mycolicibacterium hodleri TaxID=49897 RepID=A0A502E7A6_9MYCO|nr:ABC transporter permease [Mycolicibacterium hodleri]TPG33608.1 ABC transporter permease [Mycolicibacterium hodleri]
MTSEADSAPDIAAIDELRFLADSLRRVDAATAAANWDEHALAAVVADARAELTSAHESLTDDIASAAASAQWRGRAGDYVRDAALTCGLVVPPEQANANAVVAIALARAAIAEAILAVAGSNGADGGDGRASPTKRIAVLRRAPVSGVGRRIAEEVRHVMADKPRNILIRLLITLGIALSLVSVYHFSGRTRYDDVSRLSLYLFSAVVGSVVCTNSLCFEAQRVRDAMARGERIWRILVAKNLAMAALVTVAALPVIGFLTVAYEGNPIALVDQLVTMVFIWLGVGNVLSVLYPIRHEPFSARLHDGTWKPFLFSFALSYGVGLTVNLMIFWRLWSRQTASSELAGGEWAAFLLVLGSAITSWVLLTVFAVTCSREPRVRRILSREMVTYLEKSNAS